MFSNVKHITKKGTLRDLALFSLVTTGLTGNPIAVYNYLKGTYIESESKLFLQ